MSKWTIITADGDYRPVAPGCGVVNLLGDMFRPRIIQRVTTHAVLCMTDSPCGQQYSTPAEAHNAISQFQQPRQLPQPPADTQSAPWCTCDARTGLDTAGEPDFFCRYHHPENHQTRELMAADGYTRRARAVAPHLNLPTWQALPASGKEMWRTWAECEMWTEDLG